MKRVVVKNRQGIQTHGAEMEDPTAWIAEQVSHNSWGKPQREVTADQEDVSGAFSQREELDPLTGETRTLYTLPAEYTIDIQDMTAEVDAQKAAHERKAALKAKVKSLKANDLNTVAKLTAAFLELVEMLDS